MNKIINKIEKKYLKKNIPFFKQGDFIEIKILIKEGNKKKTQIFKGLVIAIRNRGLNSSFTVRKISHGEGIERVFNKNSPIIKEIKLDKRGIVKRAKLYYLRTLKGKAAKIREKLIKK
ncbi:50S ribosomal protein L19 [Candidatus Purcelliella pentastirinorum]|uniref:50S ribosomal protein L19 n=1 Tax=Candidatus Purcelliella pentastirinorum TaxID=472834 RepID=UPI0023680C59|nr:50S ribosomal protein L19 [Candidatus Purcelliella pentastirinorum]WDI79050.1 50S ribosomal protein L19 [Candidatus Purcelliella pentastirinorum]WDR80188.1 50S ribosomal protein L19 [Candidatus Purcelliella pentastirinorum]